MTVNLPAPSAVRAIHGFKMGTADAGIRKFPGEDLVVVTVPTGATIAGVFTRNKARAAPVEVAIRHLESAGGRQRGLPRALVINSGNANAGLGAQGIADCLAVCDLVAEQLGMERQSVLPFSTGVIGERLPIDKFSTGINNCVATLNEDNWLAAARAIMTTDTVPKVRSRTVELATNRQFTVSGMAKGSGMIAPDMATMLAFIATDAQVPSEYLQVILNQMADESFNCISVDGDTSTNDACILVATAQSGVKISRRSSETLKRKFEDAIRDVAVNLAQSIIRDGEGATKFVTINVTHGATDADCMKIAKVVAASPLVKTAFHASDPNWGRIYAAIGRTEVVGLDMSQVSISINDVNVFCAGASPSDYDEQEAVVAMAAAEFSINIDLGQDNGCGSATVWTTDLSDEYVRINAEYRS